MPNLHIALQDGFTHDAVRIRLGPREIYRSRNVSTRQQFGLADSFDIPVPRGEVALDVTLADRPRTHQRITLHVASDDAFVSISLDEHGQLRWRVTSTRASANETDNAHEARLPRPPVDR
jgi:hypothetical protein